MWSLIARSGVESELGVQSGERWMLPRGGLRGRSGGLRARAPVGLRAARGAIAGRMRRRSVRMEWSLNARKRAHAAIGLNVVMSASADDLTKLLYCESVSPISTIHARAVRVLRVGKSASPVSKSRPRHRWLNRRQPAAL
jgi:hypothetical protein